MNDLKRVILFSSSLFIFACVLYFIAGTDLFVMPAGYHSKKIRALEIRIERIEKALRQAPVMSFVPSLEEQERMKGF